MNAVDFKGAVLRGWRLLLVLAFLAGIVAVLLPNHPGKARVVARVEAKAVLTPGGTSLTQLVSDAENPKVLKAAAQADHVSALHPGASFAIASSKSFLGKNVSVPAIEVTATRPTAAKAAAAVDDYITALRNYMTQQNLASYQAELCRSQQTIDLLQSELATVESNIIKETNRPGSVTSATDNLAPPPSSANQCSGDQGSTTPSSTTPSSTASAIRSDGGSAGPVQLTADNSRDSATPPTTAPTTAQSTPPTTAASATTTTTPASTTTTAPPSGQGVLDAELAVLNGEKSSLTDQLNKALASNSSLTVSGAQSSTFAIVRAPSAAGAASEKPKKTKVSPFASRKVRLGIGVGAGVILGLLILLLVEFFDRSIRSAVRAESSFNCPVVAEIPAMVRSKRSRRSRFASGPQLDVVLSPTSRIAEAYRGLQAVITLGPLASDLALNATELGSVSGSGAYSGGYTANALGSGVSGAGVFGSGDAPEHNGRDTTPKRDVVLVVSADAEPTRSAVVANLAAAYAQGGKRVLVMTMEKLGWRRPGSQAALPASTSQVIDPGYVISRSAQSVVEGVRALTFDQLLDNRGQVVNLGPAVIGAAREVADIVIVEGPPLLKGHDFLALLPAVDVVLAVAEYGTTKIPQGTKAADLLRRFRAPLLGVVFTNVPGKSRSVKPVLGDHDFGAGPPTATRDADPTLQLQT